MGAANWVCLVKNARTNIVATTMRTGVENRLAAAATITPPAERATASMSTRKYPPQLFTSSVHKKSSAATHAINRLRRRMRSVTAMPSVINIADQVEIARPASRLGASRSTNGAAMAMKSGGYVPTTKGS